MTNENNMTERRARIQRRVPGFDPMKFAREIDREGKKTLTMPVEHKKTWFRLACPNGGVVLNPLRVTDQMAIFEARLFADTEDRNPLASFTATRKADKSTGGQYIRAAQDDALDEALENAGFSLQLYAMEPAAKPVPEPTAVSDPPVTADTPKPKAGAPKAAQAKPEEPVKQVPTPEKVPEKAAPSVKQAEQVPEKAPKTAPPATAPQRPAPVGPMPRSSAPAAQRGKEAPVVDIATRRPPVEAGNTAKHVAQSAPVAAPTSPTAAQPAPTAVQPAPVAAQPAPEAAQPAPAAAQPTSAVESSPASYTADMTMEEICQRMTLEQAKAIKVQDGTCRGWTLEQVAADRPASLKWLRFAAPFGDNVLKAAAQLVLNDLELKASG